jgi:hypothetical protein
MLFDTQVMYQCNKSWDWTGTEQERQEKGGMGELIYNQQRAVLLFAACIPAEHPN